MHVNFHPQQSSPCDFGSVPGIYVEDTTDVGTTEQRFGYSLAETGTNFISASLAILVDDVSLLYVAHSGRIQVVRIVCKSIH